MEEVLNQRGAIYLLSDNHELDKACELFRISYTHNDWDEANKVADYMHSLAESLYHTQLRNAADGKYETLDTKHPLVFYYAYSYLAKSIYYQNIGQYEKARDYIMKYSEMGWFMGLDQSGHEEVERFRFLAKANLYSIDLLLGKKELLSEYVQFLHDNDEELLPGMVGIAEAANLNNWDIDDLLNEFADDIKIFEGYEDRANRVYYLKLVSQLAIYHLKKKQHIVALNYILASLKFSVGVETDADFRTLVALFETFRDVATPLQQEQYQAILLKALHNEKGINLDNYGLSVS
ncbi:DNA-binding protein [Paenibacillus sp. CMAA1739]|uniref:DNA-binding protein n=1 Tax=Paenibacillus ottowii TaxID=2315729 RepID=UPI002730800B|nr:MULTISPECIES: DNA-binding protein [Paenibacillus]MDP1510482.1 DNA-binding protein [Paenibacillus ottowii]MEC4565898.1 DNA-binding protein [Paenibacillus sp. CMAA1739]